MRVTLSIDSATAQEAEAFIYSYQRSGRNLMEDEGKSCTAQMMGAWHVQTPPLSPNHARVMSEDFFAWLNERSASTLMAAIDRPPADLRAVPEEKS